MIKVIGKYGIEASDKCYAAGKIGKMIDKKTGKETEYIQNPAYCTSVSSALKAVRKRMQIDSIKNMDCDLETAINEMRKLDERFNKLIEKIEF